MRWLKRLLYLLLIVVLVVAGLFFYFLYVPTVDEPDLAGTFTSDSLVVDGNDRYFSWYTPADKPKKPALIFFLHGSNNSGDILRKATGYEFDQLAEQHGFVLVYPQGYKKHWNDCRGSANYAANTENIDDNAFFESMIDYFADKASIDRRRVYVAGISNGGQLAYKLAFESPGLIQSIATLAANLPEADNLDCEQSGQPISVAMFNGTEDAINPYNGGLVDLYGDTSRGSVLSTIETVNYWRDLAGITSEPLEQTFPERDGLSQTSVIEQRWQNDKGIQIRLYTLQGSGHVMPSMITRAPRILGEKAGDISAAEEMVDFFLSPSQ